MTTETETMPNPVAGDSVLGACKSKKGKGLRKPNTELFPNDCFRGQVGHLLGNDYCFAVIGCTSGIGQQQTFSTIKKQRPKSLSLMIGL